MLLTCQPDAPSGAHASLQDFSGHGLICGGLSSLHNAGSALNLMSLCRGGDAETLEQGGHHFPPLDLNVMGGVVSSAELSAPGEPTQQRMMMRNASSTSSLQAAGETAKRSARQARIFGFHNSKN